MAFLSGSKLVNDPSATLCWRPSCKARSSLSDAITMVWSQPSLGSVQRLEPKRLLEDPFTAISGGIRGTDYYYIYIYMYVCMYIYIYIYLDIIGLPKGICHTNYGFIWDSCFLFLGSWKFPEKNPARPSSMSSASHGSGGIVVQSCCVLVCFGTKKSRRVEQISWANGLYLWLSWVWKCLKYHECCIFMHFLHVVCSEVRIFTRHIP